MEPLKNAVKDPDSIFSPPPFYSVDSSPHGCKTAAVPPGIVSKIQAGRKDKNELPLWGGGVALSFYSEREPLPSMLPLTKLDNIPAITVFGFNQS